MINACELPNTGARFVNVVVTASSSKANATENHTNVAPLPSGDLPANPRTRFRPRYIAVPPMTFQTSASAAAISMTAPSNVWYRLRPSAAMPANSSSINGMSSSMMSALGEGAMERSVQPRMDANGLEYSFLMPGITPTRPGLQRKLPAVRRLVPLDGLDVGAVSMVCSWHETDRCF